METLSQFDYVIEYVKGNSNVVSVLPQLFP